MTYNISINLDLRYKNKDEEYPVCLILYIRRSKYYIPLDVSVCREHWDKANEKILPGAKLHPSVGWYNDRIFEKKLNARKILVKLDENNEIENLTGSDIKRRIQNKSNRLSFSAYIDNQIYLYKKHNKDGSAFALENAKTFLKNYIPEKKIIYFDDINYKFLKTLEYKFIAKGNSYNGLSTYLRSIRSVYNMAIKEWPELKAKYPFGDKYKIKEVKSHKTAIGRVDLEKLKNLPIDHKHLSWHGRNMFFLSFYCRGMNLADIAKLKMNNVQNGKITYRRSKNSKPFSIRVNEQILSIIDLYQNINNGPEDYIFPIIRKDSKKTALLQLRDFRNVTNHALKRWAKKLSIDSSLSFNTARHCWATIGKEMNIPIAMLSEGLGHNDIRTTQIYLDAFQDDAIDDANDLITQNQAI